MLARIIVHVINALISDMCLVMGKCSIANTEAIHVWSVFATARLKSANISYLYIYEKLDHIPSS